MLSAEMGVLRFYLCIVFFAGGESNLFRRRASCMGEIQGED